MNGADLAVLVVPFLDGYSNRVEAGTNLEEDLPILTYTNNLPNCTPMDTKIRLFADKTAISNVNNRNNDAILLHDNINFPPSYEEKQMEFNSANYELLRITNHCSHLRFMDIINS